MAEGTPEKHFTQYPLALIAAAMTLGIAAERIFPLNVFVVAIVLFVATLSAYPLRRSRTAAVLICVAFASLGSLCYLGELQSIRPDRIRSLIDNGAIASGDAVEIEGELSTPPEPTADGYIVTLSAEAIIYRDQKHSASGNVELFLPLSDDETLSEYEDLDLSYGSRVTVACNLEREEQYQDPGVASPIELLDRQGIDASGTLKSPLLIEKLGESPRFVVLSWVYESRQSLIGQFHSRFSASAAGVLTASMLGDKYFLDKPSADVFREGGTFHILVISGLHITFIGGILLLLVRAFTRDRLFQFITVSAMLWAYTLAVGADVPVVRTSLMFTALLFSRVIYRQGSLSNSLGACVIIFLAWRPSTIFDPSFQLTVVSVTAIVAMAFPLIEKLRSIGSWIPTAATPFPPNAPQPIVKFCEMLYWQPVAWNIESSRQIWSARIFKSPYLSSLSARGGKRILAYAFEGLVVSLIVQLWLLPFLVIFFHRVTPVSVVMNLWVGVVIAAESISALAAVVVSHFSQFLGSPFFWLAELFNSLLISVPEYFVRSQWASWRVPHYSGSMRYLYPVYFVPLISAGSLLWLWDPFAITRQWINAFSKRISIGNSIMASAVVVILLAGIVVFHPFSSPAPDGRLHIDFLDVGQGDALVTFPDGTTMLIDGGGRPDFRNSEDDLGSDVFVPDRRGIGETVVSPVLWEKGYSNIDYIVATHADADHIQGLNDVAKNFQVGQALFGRMPVGDPEFMQLDSVLESRGITKTLIYRGQIFRFGSATVEVLYPRLDSSAQAPSDNNHSIVFRITYGGRSFLFTGDIEEPAESDLVNSGGVLKANVIKVPHHGSRTSSTALFIDAVRPDYAIISVGRHSRFGHPHAEVVDRWKAAGTRVMTTGERGMISVSTNGSDVVVSQYH